MIFGNRLHKARFCKKGGVNQNYPHKEGVGAKGGEPEKFQILREVCPKKGDSYLGAHYV